MKKIIIYTISFFAMGLATVLMILLLALLYYKYMIGEDKFIIATIVIYFISSMIGGILVGRAAENRKFLYGMGAGIGYFLILLLASAIDGNGTKYINGKIFLSMIVCVFGGLSGGILSGISNH